MKLTTQTQVTVDGVMQGNGGASSEDRRAGFERGGWARGKATRRPGRSSTRPTSAPTRSCSCRRTYEIFARGWGVMDPGSHPIADALNTKPKYLALDLVDSRADSKGVTMQVYRPTARPRDAT